MPILPIPSPTTSFHIGLRAIIRSSEASIVSFGVSTPRAFSTALLPPRASCFRYSPGVPACLSRAIKTPPPPNSISHVHIRTIFTFRPITRYIDLPESYEDANGLPIRKKDLDQKESNGIFPSNLPAPQANRLLKILHGRRVAGTLNDPSLTQNTREFRATDQAKALAYLRKHHPVEEVLNAGLRAEDELSIIESEQEDEPIKDAEELSSVPHIEQPIENVSEESTQAPTGRLPKKPGSDSPYGESTFDRIRARNIAKREAEEAEAARLEEERKLLEKESGENTGTLQTQQARKPRELSEFAQKHALRATSNLAAPPEMTVSQRLLPSLGLAVVVIIGAMAFAAWYEPPSASRRLLPGIPPAAATCLTLIAMNIAVWGLWKFPPAWRIFNKYMLVIVATPRPLQLLGAMFSHHTSSHLIANMICLWWFGTRVHDDIGRGNFLALYISSGVMGFATSFAYMVLRRDLYSATLGASGAVYGLITGYFWLHKFEEFKVFGYPPDPISGPQGLGFIALVLGLHIIPLFSKGPRSSDLISHFGGMLAGVVGVELIEWYAGYKARKNAEGSKETSATNTALEDKPITSADMNVSQVPPSEPR